MEPGFLDFVVERVASVGLLLLRMEGAAEAVLEEAIDG